MLVLVAPDKFKDSLTASQACAAISAGLRAAHPDWTLDLCPLTDGGEGFASILTEAAGGEWRDVTVTGPRGIPVVAGFGLVATHRLPAAVGERLGELPAGGTLAVIEMAAASGLALLGYPERDVWSTDTRGVGELIAAATRAGAHGIVLGVGGSATNDLGLGALVALGAQPLTALGQPVMGCAPVDWREISRVELGGLLQTPPIWIACDVTNPLLGPDGAAAVYGPQKGLCAEDVHRLDAEAARMAALLEGGDRSLAEVPGAGAAGGIAFGLMATLHARLVPGFDLVSEWLALENRVDAADLVITGEGRFDASSLSGKGAGSLVRMARARGKPVRVFAGSVDADEGPGFTLHEVSPRDLPLSESIANAPDFLRARVAEAC